jgi:hypothetical protein
MPASKTPQRLNFRSLVLLLLIFLSINLAVFYLIHTRYQDSYYAALIDKISILENSPSPRLVFVGGSNIVFGIDSEIIGQQTGYNVVNMGLNGNLGIRFMLGIIEPFLQPGDVVVVIPEYDLILDTNESIGPAFIQVIIANPSLLKYFNSPQEYYYFLKLFPYVYSQAIKTMLSDYLEKGCIICENEEQIYFRTAFNRYGDIISHEKVHPIWEIGHLYLSFARNDSNLHKYINIVNKFSERIDESGAKIIMAYPATPSPGDKRTQEMLSLLDEILRSELIISVSGNPSDAWYSRDLFFDKLYHLSVEGREVNTQRIIEQISPFITNND